MKRKGDKKLFVHISETWAEEVPGNIYRYCEGKGFSILKMSYLTGVNDGIKMFQQEPGEHKPLPDELVQMLQSPEYTKISLNANRERVLLSYYLNQEHEFLDPSQWVCINSLQRALGAETTRQEEVITVYSVLCLYYTVEPLDINDRRNYIVDQIINDRGFLVDKVLLEKCLGFYRENELRLKREFLKQSCNKVDISDNQGIKVYVEAYGFKMESFSKVAIIKLLKNPEVPENIKKMLKLKTEYNMVSVKKLESFNQCICSDNRVRGAFLYYGSHTGRWSGVGVQPQNLPQASATIDEDRKQILKANSLDELLAYKDNINELLSGVMRSLIIAPEGKKLAVFDYSMIESRVLSWMADIKWKNEAFLNDKDIYVETAKMMYKCTDEEALKRRKAGKICELALGYGGGVNALSQFCGDTLSDKDKQYMVKAWREANKEVPELWKQMEEAFRYCLRNKTEELKLTKENGAEVLTIVSGPGDDTKVILPSGRVLVYWKMDYQGELVYMDKERVVRTYGGVLVENVVQAIARDILAESLRKIQDKYSPVLHIHDEIVVEISDEKEYSNIGLLMESTELSGLKLRVKGSVNSYYSK